jgi:DHA1 family bicyclomycin/chloramphenicol resistance-like MFS transporter
MVMALPLAMDIYIPAVPHMADVFHVSAATMQLTLTLFMLTAGLMQLLIGPLSDHFGRKPTGLVVIFIFAIGCILCALSTSAPLLIIFRAIQAIGCCGMMVVGSAVVRDLFHGEKSAKVYSFLNGIIAFSPMFAPFIGSYLDIHFNWPSTFLFLLIIALWAGFSIGIYLPETVVKKQPVKSEQQKSSVNKLMALFNEYRLIFINKIFLPYTITTAIGLSYLYLFCSISPYVIIRLLHLPEEHYGFYFAFMGISIFIGSFIATWLVERMGIFATVLTGLFLSLAGGLIMLCWFYMTGLTVNNFIWPMLLIGLGATCCMGAGSGGAMEPFGENAGAASALGGAIRFMFASLAGAIAIREGISSTLPLAVPVVLFSMIGIIMFFSMRKTLSFRLRTAHRRIEF